MSVSNTNLKYIAFYNDNRFNTDEKRNTNLAVTNKINYICSALTRNGYEVEIVSPCWSDNQSGFYKGKEYDVADKVKLRNFATFGTSNKLTKKIKQLFAAFQLLLYLITHTKKHEQIIVYHSLALMLPIRLAKAFKKLNIVLEVEEVYTDVWETKTTMNKEIDYINKAEKYILVSDVLKKMFSDKPSVILYGSYNVLNTDNVKKSKTNTIDIVYAGSIDGVKGGARNAVLCAESLPDNYRMHILGFGEKQAINKLNQDIKSVNLSKGFDCCKYHGIMVGDDYKNFLLNCDIGVNPQYQGEYMNTAFPSKVLSYLTHKLKVVSTEINSIKLSKVAPFITFAESDEPEAMSKAIVNAVNEGLENDNHIVKELDTLFVKGIKSLVDG